MLLRLTQLETRDTPSGVQVADPLPPPPVTPPGPVVPPPVLPPADPPPPPEDPGEIWW